MKTNTITTIVLVGILAFTLAACSKSNAPTPAISERTEPPKPPDKQQPTLPRLDQEVIALQPPKDQKPTPPTMDQEAAALAEKAFSETWAQVGDSWFTLLPIENPTDIIQIRGFTHKVRRSGPSEAEILNGFQWTGDVEFSCRVWRGKSLASSQWRDWADGEPYWNGWLLRSYPLSKKNGQWTNAKKVYEATKPSEEQIKNILTK